MNRAMERSAQWPSAMSANPKANAKASKKTLKKTVCSNLCRIMHTRCPGVERQLVCVLPRGLLIMIVYRSTPAYAVYAPCFAMALIPHKTTAMHFGCQNHHGRSAVDDHIAQTFPGHVSQYGSLGAASACAAEHEHHENVQKDEFPAAYERERSVWMPEAPQVSALQNR